MRMLRPLLLAFGVAAALALPAAGQSLSGGGGGSSNGPVSCGQLPAITGDAPRAAGNCGSTVVAVNGVPYPASPPINTIPYVSSGGFVLYGTPATIKGLLGLSGIATSGALADGTGQITAAQLPGTSPGAGTFTPTFAPATPGDFAMTCTCTGSYFKVGPLVFVTVSIAGTPTFTGAATGNLTIGNLPFAANVINQTLGVANVTGFTWPSSTNGIACRLGSGAVATIQSLRTSTTPTTWQPSNMTSGTAIALVCSGVYQANS